MEKSPVKIAAQRIIIALVATAIALWAWLQFGNFGFGAGEYCLATVESVESYTEEVVVAAAEGQNVTNKYVFFDAALKSGKYSGLTVEAVQYIDNLFYVTMDEVTPGARVVLIKTMDYHFGEEVWSFVQYDRIGHMVALVAAFLLLILLIGRSKGLATIYSLVLTVIVIFTAFIPSVLRGSNIYVAAILVSVYTIFMTLLLLNGFSLKTFAAIVGNIGGILVSGVLAYTFSKAVRLTGVINDEFASLMWLDGVSIDLQAVLWAGMVIGALGAIMDVAMSISSALNELAEEMRERSFKAMWRSGMNIGKDAIGTMTNTLILAYIGSELASVLLLAASNRDLVYLFNLEMIVAEVLQAVIGSMGILFTVPLTTLFSAFIFNIGAIRRQKDDRIYY